MRTLPYLEALPRGLLIALAPFLLLHYALGVADLYRADKPDIGYTTGRDLHTVLSVNEGGPADRAGLRAGDRILEIDGMPVDRLDLLIPATGSLRVGHTVRVRYERDGATGETTLVIGALPRETRLHDTTTALVGLAFLAVGLVVVLRRSDTMAIVFYSLSLVFAFLFAPQPMRPSLEWHLFVKILYTISFALLPALFVHFFLIFPYRRKFVRDHPRIVPAIYTVSLLLLAVAAMLDVLYLLKGRYDLLRAIRLVSAITGFLVFIGMTGGVASLFLSYLRTPAGSVRRRLTVVVFGTALGITPIIAAGIASGISPGITIPGARYFHLSLFLIPFSFAYAIVRYGLMDLEILLKRSVIYTSLTALLVAIYLLVVEGFGRFALGRGGQESWVLKLVSILLMAIVFSPIRSRIQAWVDRSFYRERLNYRETLRDVSEQLSGFLELEPLVDLLARKVHEALQVSGVSVYLEKRTPDGRAVAHFALAGHAGNHAGSAACYTWNPSDQIVQWAAERRGVLPVERLQESVRWNRLPRGEKQALRELHAALVLPLMSGDRLLGIMVVGNKGSEDLHSNEDVALLRTVVAHASVAIDNALLHKSELARVRIEEELALARKIQESFLPATTPRIPGVELCAMNVPCLEVGGDYYDFIYDEENGRLGVAIGDASGKGVPAAILMASFQAAFHSEAETHPSPARVLERLNRLIIRQTRSERFVTFFYGILDTRTRVLTYANAGHNPPVLIRADGSMIPLENANLLLGVSDESAYEEAEIPLGVGDTLLLYTDGVTDELNPQDEMFGIDRLEATLVESGHLPLGELLGSVYRAVADFMKGAPQDDITLVGMKLR